MCIRDRAEGEPGHNQTPSLTTSPSLPLADRTRTIRMMVEAPLGASAPSCFIGTPFISCDSHFSHRRFSRTVIATSRIPTSPINAQSPPAVHILLYNARIMPFRGSCTRIGVATLRASCAASHSHAGPHRARNEPSGGVNEIRNTPDCPVRSSNRIAMIDRPASIPCHDEHQSDLISRRETQHETAKPCIFAVSCHGILELSRYPK